MAEPHVVVLAAGWGTRFGGSKLEAPCAGKPLGRWVLDAVAEAGLSPGTIVIGPEAAHFADGAPGWKLLVNPQPQAGLAGSLALAAKAAMERDDEALLVLLADMPLIPAAYLRELAKASPPAATRQADGRPGVPAVLDRALLEATARLTGDRGAGPLLANASLMEAPQGALCDVDTAEDLADVQRQLRAR